MTRNYNYIFSAATLRKRHYFTTSDGVVRSFWRRALECCGNAINRHVYNVLYTFACINIYIYINRHNNVRIQKEEKKKKRRKKGNAHYVVNPITVHRGDRAVGPLLHGSMHQTPRLRRGPRVLDVFRSFGHDGRSYSLRDYCYYRY